MNLHKPNYHAWLIDQKDFPKRGTNREKITFIAGYGILAPSQHNTQPWFFEVKPDDTLVIAPDKAKALSVGDPDDRGLYIAIGACVENIVQAGVQLGLTGSVVVQKDIVCIKFEQNTPVNSDTTRYITKRHSDKSIYSGKGITEPTLSELRKITARSADLKVITDDKELLSVKHIHMAAAATVASNPLFVRELVNWLRTNKTRASDGMPGFVTGMSNARSIVARALLTKKPELFRKALMQDERLFDSASLVAVWGVKNQTAADFIECGRLIERFWLKAVQLGLVAHPMTASVNDDAASRKLARILGMQTVPVFLMRVGYHEETGLRTPRRSAICN